MRPTTATLGIRVTASVTLRELYGARGAGIRAIAPPFGAARHAGPIYEFE